MAQRSPDPRPPGPPRLVTEADTLEAATRASGANPSPPIPASRPPSSSSASLDGGRFAPGTIVGARYRVIGLLGRGGMGEVYRAEDLRLGEQVALKFLPEKLVEDGAALARFHREVRTARLITHRNVVRVHDLGEIEGQPYLSMEYVDGEDLASLLRRIGRLPPDKALELARQLCAGLAAAHDRDVLHRDLKPGNVLVDGQGRAKITDFGLAALASELESPELAGTPAYMAPEQLGEGRVSYASDLYSLGLVFYEMFTGRRPFAGDERQQVSDRLHKSDPPRMSNVVSGLDPQLDEVVQRCLRLEPERRPKSAIDVAAALPGGDPLAAALAAGETPSPEMVAGAREAGTLSRRVALAVLGLFVAGLASTLIGVNSTSAVRLADPLPPQVLSHQAQTVLDLTGQRADHRVWDFTYTKGGIHRLRSERHDLQGWRDVAAARPGLMEFWYRESVEPIQPKTRFTWRTMRDDPPATTPGSALVELDGAGRLQSLLVVPTSDAIAPSAPTSNEPDWTPYFTAAGLSIADFTPAVTERAPPIHADRVASWTGRYPGQPNPPVRIDAAARDGRVVFWRASPVVQGESEAVFDELPAIAFVAFALMWIGAGFLAHRHFKSGSGDRRGALRLGAFAATAAFVGPLLLAHHTAAREEFFLVFAALAQGTMIGAIAWLLYMGLEPYARRTAPRWFVSWTRLLEGRWQDPMVGRDLLCGMTAAAALNGILAVGTRVLLQRSPMSLDWAYPHGMAPLRGALATLANVLHPATLLVSFGVMAVLVASRALIKNERVAIAVAAFGVAGFDLLVNGPDPGGVLTVTILIVVAVRWGLLGLVALTFFVLNTKLVPVSADPSAWWAASSWLGWGATLAVAIYGYRTAVARPKALARA